MTGISPGWLIVLYLIGWCAAVYIGMRISDRMWRRRENERVRAAYSRGWNAGFGFLNKISDARTDEMSSVTVHEVTQKKQGL